MFKEKGIPFYNEMEYSSGLRLAMPFQPSMGPGTFYSILVPKPFVETAKQTLEELPFKVTTTPDSWHFVPSDKIKRIWKVGIRIYLTMILLLYVFNMFAFFK